MTHNYHHQIDRIVKANKVYRFEAELEETTDDERTETLKKLVVLYNAYKDEKQIKEDKLKAHLKVLKDSQYQKKWQFLTQEQRLNRLDEFIERSEIKDEKVIKLLRDSIKTGALKTKVVEYDKLKCQIEELTILVIDEKTKECQLDYSSIGKNADDEESDQKPNDLKKRIIKSSKSIKEEDTKENTKKVVKKTKTDNQSEEDTESKNIAKPSKRITKSTKSVSLVETLVEPMSAKVKSTKKSTVTATAKSGTSDADIKNDKKIITKTISKKKITKTSS